MARFIKLDDMWVNIDLINRMSYEVKEDETICFFGCNINDYLIFDGDVTRTILNANNDLTMRDKSICNYIEYKFKSVLASILARLDSISKDTERLLKK